MNRGVVAAALVAAIACCCRAALAADRVDPDLLAALRADAAVRTCGCVTSAAWIDESYPRIVVDRARFAALGAAARGRLGAAVLRVAERIYLAENAGTDQYAEVFFVDRAGKRLGSYAPS